MKAEQVLEKLKEYLLKELTDIKEFKNAHIHELNEWLWHGENKQIDLLNSVINKIQELEQEASDDKE